MRRSLRQVAAALRDFLVGFLDLPSARLGSAPSDPCDQSSEATRVQHALEAHCARRRTCC